MFCHHFSTVSCRRFESCLADISAFSIPVQISGSSQLNKLKGVKAKMFLSVLNEEEDRSLLHLPLKTLEVLYGLSRT